MNFKRLAYIVTVLVLVLATPVSVMAQTTEPDSAESPLFIVIDKYGYASIRWVSQDTTDSEEFIEANTGKPYQYPKLWSYGIWIEHDENGVGRVVIPNTPIDVFSDKGSGKGIMLPQYYANDTYRLPANGFSLFSVVPCASWTVEHRNCTSDIVYYVVFQPIDTNTWHIRIARAIKIETRAVPAGLNHFAFEYAGHNADWTAYSQK